MRNCKWCNNPIQPNHHGVVGVECDRCWELRFRMEDDIELASKILAQLTRRASGRGLQPLPTWSFGSNDYQPSDEGDH
jgi:hypothetical protein